MAPPHPPQPDPAPRPRTSPRTSPCTSPRHQFVPTSTQPQRQLLFPKTARDSQFIQFGEQGAKGKGGDSGKGGADAAGAGGKAKSSDDGPALVPLKPGAFDNMSDDENEGGGGGGDEEGREAPAAPLKASRYCARLERCPG